MMDDLMYPKNDSAGRLPAMFAKMLAHGALHRLWAKLTRHSFQLLDLEETLKKSPLESSHYAGIKSVSIDRIRGTEGKTNEFDAEFNPTQERSRTRWIAIAREKLRGYSLPPVELIQIGNIYYVRDGHHRISASRALGQAYVDAEVTIIRLRQQNWLH